MTSTGVMKRFGSLLVGWLTVALFCIPAYAGAIGGIAQGYKTSDSGVVIGSIVSVDPLHPDTAQLANSDRVKRLVGVVGNKPLVELSSNVADIQVVVSGLTQTLVSDINGPIKAGDKITASPIFGVGMKAQQSTEIIGTAQADFVAAASTETVKDRNGKTQTVRLGMVPVQVNIEYYNHQSGQASSFLPPVLQDWANSLAGRSVPPLRVLASLLILIFCIGTVTVILYTSIRSSMNSIGRNPLAQTAIRKGLLEVIVVAIVIFVLAILAAFVVLRI